MNGDGGEGGFRTWIGQQKIEITILASAGVIIAAIHYLLVDFEFGVVRDDIRRLAERVRERGGRGHERP